MSVMLLTGANFNGQRGQNGADPSAPQDFATKAYVDNLIQGLKWKLNAQVATTANITLSGIQTIDGVAGSAGFRVLVKDQTTASQNGLYVMAAGAWTRATDADTAAEVETMAVVVDQGTTNSDKIFVQTANAPVTLGTTNLAFATLSGGVTYTAGTGLTLSSNQFAVDTAVVARKYSTNIGDGSSTSIAVVHGLGTGDVTVEVKVVSTGEIVHPDKVVGTGSPFNVTLTFPSAPSVGQYRCTVIG